MEFISESQIKGFYATALGVSNHLHHQDSKINRIISSEIGTVRGKNAYLAIKLSVQQWVEYFD